jgi:hypothetical protein
MPSLMVMTWAMNDGAWGTDTLVSRFLIIVIREEDGNGQSRVY